MIEQPHPRDRSGDLELLFALAARTFKDDQADLIMERPVNGAA